MTRQLMVLGTSARSSSQPEVAAVTSVTA
ncbi:Protein of unknown function [Propionibacterium freudenreichii]|nr:Protein of unknown function [Propionibacterium freudenreichii subsp. freudenreichii]CEG85637.1 Protein of unknown function [Propionibacterium freudenreichii]CEG88631.1 Protein of unknown function [Propionibacterium freudenreichii]CEG96396.1 Protein of unknown function [Propionibacterium freudenreichii]CEH01522.1 Protein of unknown function [Propionibacterium freudenreichii]